MAISEQASPDVTLAWGKTVSGGTAVSAGSGGIAALKRCSVPGNLGRLNIEITSSSASAPSVPFEYGVRPDQMANEIGLSTISLCDDTGASITHEISGTPVLKASLETALDTRVGQVAFRLHEHVSYNVSTPANQPTDAEPRSENLKSTPERRMDL